jgi:hypothetical protein
VSAAGLTPTANQSPAGCPCDSSLLSQLAEAQSVVFGAGSAGSLVTGISNLKHRTQHISLHPELGASGGVPAVLVRRGGVEPRVYVRSQDGSLRHHVEHPAFGLGRPEANDSTGHVLTGRRGDIVARVDRLGIVQRRDGVSQCCRCDSIAVPHCLVEVSPQLFPQVAAVLRHGC